MTVILMLALPRHQDTRLELVMGATQADRGRHTLFTFQFRLFIANSIGPTTTPEFHRVGELDANVEHNRRFGRSLESRRADP